MAPGAGENDEKKTTKDSYPRHLSKTMETSHHAEGLGILMAHAPAGPHDEGCQATPLPTSGGRGPLCASHGQMEAPLFVLFSKHFPFFLRVALGKRKENVFTRLLDIWDLEFLWKAQRVLCSVVSCPLWVFMFRLVPIDFPRCSQLRVS